MELILKELPDFGDHMTIESFIEAVKNGDFIDYDGSGKYATSDKITNIVVIPSDVFSNRINQAFTHVVWFNR